MLSPAQHITLLACQLLQYYCGEALRYYQPLEQTFHAVTHACHSHLGAATCWHLVAAAQQGHTLAFLMGQGSWSDVSDIPPKAGDFVEHLIGSTT